MIEQLKNDNLAQLFKLVDECVAKFNEKSAHRDILIEARAVFDKNVAIHTELGEGIKGFSSFIGMINDQLYKTIEREHFDIPINGVVIDNDDCIWKCSNDACRCEEHIYFETDLDPKPCPLCSSTMKFHWWTHD